MVLGGLKKLDCLIVREASNLAVVGDTQLYEPGNVSAE
jgi:hypothetical protein